MPERTGGKPGAKRVKQRVNKAGFYSRVMAEADKLDFESAAGVDGIDEEIALLRVKIKSVMGNDPESIKLLIGITNALERLIRTRYKITREQRKGLKEAIGNVLRDIALPLGISIGAALGKE